MLILLLASLLRPPSADAVWGSARALRNGQAALEDKLYDLAERHFREYIRGVDKPEEKAQGTLLLAETLYEKGDDQAVLDLLAEQEGTDQAVPGTAAGGYAFWSALAHSRLGQHDQALVLLERFEEEFPGSTYLVPALRLRIRCLLKAGETDRALEAFEALDTRHGSDAAAAENRLEWADALIERGRVKEAREQLKRLEKDFPASAVLQGARLRLGRLLLQDGDSEGGRAVLADLAWQEGVPDELRAGAMVSLAGVYEAQSNFNEALNVLTNAVTLVHDIESQHQLNLEGGLVLIRAGKLDEGKAMFGAAIVALSNRAVAAEAQLELGEVLLRQDEIEMAGQAFQNYLEAFSGQPGEADAQMGKAWSFWKRDRFAEAAVSFEKAHELYAASDQKEMALFKAADAYFAVGQYAAAQERYDKFTALYPDSALAVKARYQVAECLAGVASWDEARQGFEAVALSGDDELAEQSAMRVAMLREQATEWTEAIAAYDDVLARFPGGRFVAQARHRRGLIRYRTGDFAAALQDFEAVVADHPDSEAAEQAFFMRGYSHYLMGSNEQALGICRDFIERYPDSAWCPDVLFWLGEYNWNERAYPEAEARFLMLAERYPEAGLADDAMFWAGQAAAAVNEYRRAVEHYAALAKNYSGSELMPEARFAQGDALTELADFSRAILTFEEVVRSYPDSYLADRAKGRIGDCQFTLGSDEPERFQKALGNYRSILDSPGASVDLQMQAEYKMGRCQEKMDDPDAALEHFMNVVYRYFAEWEKGVHVGDVWFTRAAFSAASIQESRSQWEQAVSIYERIIDAGVPAAPDAQNRIEKIQLEHWLPFLRPAAD
jgi:TolA-binding protein